MMREVAGESPQSRQRFLLLVFIIMASLIRCMQNEISLSGWLTPPTVAAGGVETEGNSNRK